MYNSICRGEEEEEESGGNCRSSVVVFAIVCNVFLEFCMYFLLSWGRSAYEQSKAGDVETKRRTTSVEWL